MKKTLTVTTVCLLALAPVPAQATVATPHECYKYSYDSGVLEYEESLKPQCVADETQLSPQQAVNLAQGIPGFTTEDTITQIIKKPADSFETGSTTGTNSTQEPLGQISQVVTSQQDDYPFKSKDCANAAFGTLIPRSTPLGTYVCQCTDFVAWRINQSMGGTKDKILFHMRYDKNGRADAKNWPELFPEIAHDKTPQVGDVAVSRAGVYGHVAYVTDVSGNMITVEQYNYANAQTNFKGLAYSKVQVPAASFDTFMHFTQKKA